MATRRDLLKASLAGLVTAPLSLHAVGRAFTGEGPRKLLVVYVNGGWDTSYHIDPKPESPYVLGPEVDDVDPTNPDDVEAITTYGGLRIATNEAKRPGLSRFFERWGDRALVVNGISMGGIAHYPNRLRLLTGTSDRSRPDFATIAGSQTGTEMPFGTVDLSSRSYAGAHGATLGRIGREWQLDGLLEPSPTPFDAGPEPARAVDDAVDAYLRGQADAWLREDPAAAWPVALRDSIDRLQILRDRRAELAALIEPRGSRSAEDNHALAVGLLAGGWCRAALLPAQNQFDTHGNNSGQHKLTAALFDHLDLLLSELEDAGELDHTVVAVTSEMTRSPTRNLADGKDHWPVATHLLMGGGIAGGRMIGGTSDVVEPLLVDVASGDLAPTSGEICRYDHFMAGILAHLDIDPGDWLPGVEPLGGLSG